MPYIFITLANIFTKNDSNIKIWTSKGIGEFASSHLDNITSFDM